MAYLRLCCFFFGLDFDGGADIVGSGSMHLGSGASSTGGTGRVSSTGGGGTGE